MPTKARWSEEEYQAYLKQQESLAAAGKLPRGPMPDPEKVKVEIQECKDRYDTEMKRPKMNKTEAEYERILQMKVRDQEISAYLAHESIKLKIGAHRCWYTPDFAVIGNDGMLELHEVKGPYVRDDARVKFQAATQLYPGFRWVWAQRRKGGQWKIETF